MSTAREWFDDAQAFRQLCGDAQSQAIDETSQDFAAEMMIKANQYGLCKIADHDVPARNADTRA